MIRRRHLSDCGSEWASCGRGYVGIQISSKESLGYTSGIYKARGKERALYATLAAQKASRAYARRISVHHIALAVGQDHTCSFPGEPRLAVSFCSRSSYRNPPSTMRLPANFSHGSRVTRLLRIATASIAVPSGVRVQSIHFLHYDTIPLIRQNCVRWHGYIDTVHSELYS